MFFQYFVTLTTANTFSVQSTSFLTNDFTDSQDWIITQLKSSNTYTDCNGIRLFGGFETFGNRTLISKFYQLPPHSVVKVNYQFWKIDNWKYEDFYALIIDGVQQSTGTYDEIDGEQLCGSSGNEVISDVEVIYEHHYETLQISIAKNARLTDLINKGYWGIRDFYLYIQPCPPGCLFCEESDDREQCIKWALVYDSLSETIPKLFNDDGWYVSNGIQTTSNCQGIPILCGYGLCGTNAFVTKEWNLPTHYQLKIQFKYVQIDSWDNEIATLFIDDQVQWQQVFVFSWPLRFVSLCGWQNFLEVFLNVELNLVHSSDTIGFEFKTNLDQNATDESFGIRDFKIYTLCQFGDSYDQQCSQICGDKIIQYTEICDDGNMIPFDGCYNCQYSCVEGCSHCIKGICFECNDPWIYDVESKKCKLDCDYCDECIQGICLKCKETFTLINTKCYAVCGDGIVTSEFEQCDDGNTVPQDGCYECQFQCRSSCQDCQNWVCQDKCPYGEYFIIDQCESKCGDQIIALLEQCDDGNEIPNDGCFNCQYSCPINCEICFQGVCVQCYDNLYFDDTLKQCQSVCGDGILTLQTEQCDDNNQIPNDGCSENCMVEQDWVCFDTGECLYSKYPEFKANYMFNKNQYQYVSITFSQPVKRLNNQNDYLNTINATLINSESIPNNITIIPVIEATNEELRNVEYAVQIQINCALNSPPYLQIDLLELLYNENNAPLNNRFQIIQLQLPNYLNEAQKQVAQDMLEYSQKQMFALGAVGCFLLLTGSSMTFWVSLEILQEMSYLKYINVLFPENLMIFFDSSDLISLKPIYQFVELKFQNMPFIYKYRYFSAQEKLEFYQVNANFLYNARSLVLNYLVLFFTYFCALQFYKIMSNLQARRYCDKNELITKYIMILKYHSIKMKYQLKKYGIERLFYANSWDFFFMIFLQFHAKQLQEMAINKAAALLTFFFCFYYILKQLQSRNKYQKLKIYQIRQANVMLIIKKLWFMQILIGYQEQEVLQVILLCIINSVYLTQLLTKKEKCLQEISQQVIILIFIFSSSVYWQDSPFSFSYQTKIIVGWIQITMMVVVILLVSVVDLIESVRSVLKIISMKQPIQTVQTEVQQNRPIKFIICNNA